MAGSYEKALAARKIHNVKDTHSNRHLYGRTGGPHNFWYR
jgi:hypothetical protein